MPQQKNLHLARCPHCKSAFEVTSDELELALGAVRCGECMKIFNAHFHRIDVPKAEHLPAEEATDTSFHDPIPTLHEHYHQSEQELSAFEGPGEEWLDDEMQAFEAELETALLEPEATEEDHWSAELDETEAAEEEHWPAELDENEASPSEELDSISVNDDQELVTESRRSSHRKPSSKVLELWSSLQDFRKHLIALGVVLLITLTGLGTWLLMPDASLDQLYVEEVRIAPASSPQQMQVHFQLTNLANEDLALPNIQVELLNLSRQVIATQRVNASDLSTDVDYLEAASRETFYVEVERPSTYVHAARILPLTP